MIGIGKWRSDRRGTAALEFAIAFPMIIMLTMGTIELALMMLLDASLEIAVSEASRTGSLTQAGTLDKPITEPERVAKVRAIVESWVGRWVPGTSNIKIETFTYESPRLANMPTWIDRNNNGACDPGEGTCPPTGIQLFPGLGQAGTLTLYSVDVTRPGFTGILNMVGISSLHFVRQTVVLNE